MIMKTAQNQDSSIIKMFFKTLYGAKFKIGFQHIKRHS